MYEQISNKLHAACLAAGLYLSEMTNDPYKKCNERKQEVMIILKSDQKLYSNLEIGKKHRSHEGNIVLPPEEIRIAERYYEKDEHTSLGDKIIVPKKSDRSDLSNSEVLDHAYIIPIMTENDLYTKLPDICKGLYTRIEFGTVTRLETNDPGFYSIKLIKPEMSRARSRSVIKEPRQLRLFDQDYKNQEVEEKHVSEPVEESDPLQLKIDFTRSYESIRQEQERLENEQKRLEFEKLTKQFFDELMEQDKDHIGVLDKIESEVHALAEIEYARLMNESAEEILKQFEAPQKEQERSRKVIN